MPTKNTHQNKFIWIFAFILAFFALSIVLVPPMITLNFLKPKIEEVILSQTGVPAQIKGDVNFSLLGRTTIIAHDITVPNGIVSSCKFSIPLLDIFDLKNAHISGDISVYGASLFIEKIVPFSVKNTIMVHNSNIQFLNKEYNIIDAKLSSGNVEAIVRTDQHKYEIKSRNNLFLIKNKNNDLNLSGELYNDGTASAHIEITAQNINRWFEFEKPRITGYFPVSANLFWDGNYGVKFTDISANGITGSVDFHDNGFKIIKLKSDSANYDLSFFLQNPDVLQNAAFDLDFYGNLKFADKTFNHVKIVTIGSNNEIKIDTIIADDMEIHGGIIDKTGAYNLHVSLLENNTPTTCLFNGTPNKWACDNFSYGNNVSGTIKVDKNHFDLDIYSSEPFSDIKTVVDLARKFGTKGKIYFDCPDMKGEISVNHDKYSVSYTRLNTKSLNWANIDLPFIPDFMRNEPGNFAWTKDSMIFIPESKQWQLSKTKDFFIISGQNFKLWLPDLDLQSVRDLSYSLSGNYKNGNISNLKLEIGEQVFTGTFTNKSITLKTDVLNLDYLLDPYFTNNFEELSFFTQLPIMIPFELKKNIAISADALVYNYKKYDNFVYSLRNDTQTFSISDSNQGNILTTIKKHNIKYAINIQLNKFVFDKQLLPQNMPLNLSNTVITADIKLNTSGKIAHDIINNLQGTFDASFEGGKLYGFGFDKFYADAKSLTILNSEYLLSNALSTGITSIKKMHIVGTYNSGDIKTTEPFTLSMRHVDATGNLEIKNNEMTTDLNLMLRGTAPDIQPIKIIVFPNNRREFSLSDIMMHFDSEYMKAFVETHDKF